MPADMNEFYTLPETEQERLTQTGLDVSMENRCGSFFQLDQKILQTTCSAQGVEVLAIEDALEKYDWMADRYWNAVKRDKDKYTKFVAKQEHPKGVVVIAHKGTRAVFPVQACLYLSAEPVQTVHNIMIAEEGAELHVISGCASASGAKRGSHLGITEFYVGKNARLTSTMIHNWNPHISVYPRSAAIVEENGVFISNYVCMHPVARVQMNPEAILAENATARFSSIVIAHEGSHLDLGSRAVLQGKGSSAELVTRAITKGGTVISRGYIAGVTDETRGHIECRGLILTDGTIHAIPEIDGRVTGTELSHEAAVGKIARDEIEYLMSRGLSEEEATATIIRGFLDVKIEGLPPVLQKQIDAAIDASEAGY